MLTNFMLLTTYHVLFLKTFLFNIMFFLFVSRNPSPFVPLPSTRGEGGSFERGFAPFESPRLYLESLALSVKADLLV